MNNKNIAAISVLFAAFLFLPSTGETTIPDNISLRLLADQADLIVEGVGIESQKAPENYFPGYVGESKNTVTFNVGERTLFYFQTLRVYKGQASPAEVIKIILSAQGSRIPTEITIGKSYILFLKKTKQADVFSIIEDGQGEFRIFDYNGVPRIKTWFQLPALRAPEAYPSYEEFIQELQKSTQP